MNSPPKTRAGPFRAGEKVLYPGQGVGTLSGIEHQTVAGIDTEVFVITYDQERMTLKVPTAKAFANGLVALASITHETTLARVMKTIVDKRKTPRAMWTRRAQELEQKLNSSDLIALAEVIRDINRDDTDASEMSYSERDILRKAVQRLCDVLAFGWGTTPEDAFTRLNQHLRKHRKQEIVP
jgi:CarD family transcriptional regulator